MSTKIADAVMIDGMAFTRYSGPEKYYTEEETRKCPLCGGRMDIQDETEISPAKVTPLREIPSICARLSVYECGAVVYYRKYGTMLNIIAIRDHTSSPFFEDITGGDEDTI